MRLCRRGCAGDYPAGYLPNNPTPSSPFFLPYSSFPSPFLLPLLSSSPFIQIPSLSYFYYERTSVKMLARRPPNCDRDCSGFDKIKNFKVIFETFRHCLLEATPISLFRFYGSQDVCAGVMAKLRYYT